MKFRYKVLLGILVSFLFLSLMIWAHHCDQKTQKLVYDICIERGCTESECKLFSSFVGQMKLVCPNGKLSKDL